MKLLFSLFVLVLLLQISENSSQSYFYAFSSPLSIEVQNGNSSVPEIDTPQNDQFYNNNDSWECDSKCITTVFVEVGGAAFIGFLVGAIIGSVTAILAAIVKGVALTIGNITKRGAILGGVIGGLVAAIGTIVGGGAAFIGGVATIVAAIIGGVATIIAAILGICLGAVIVLTYNNTKPPRQIDDNHD